jgi:hypothetical protein
MHDFMIGLEQAWDVFRDANLPAQVLLVAGYITLMTVVTSFIIVLDIR